MIAHRAARIAAGLTVAGMLTAGCGSKDDTAHTVAAPATTAMPSSATTATAPATTARAITATTALPTTTTTAAPTTTSTTLPTTTSSSTTTPPTTDPPGADAGTMPQTRDKPSSSGAALEQRAKALWQAIVADDPSIAMPFFFPKAAYLQVKDIPDAGSDFEKRLVAAYEEDIHQLHGKLGTNPSSATFTSITVPNTAQWIDPGGEYNKIGYWRVYGTKISYTAAGKKQDLTIASMISWRGQWYVVHLTSIR